VPTFEHLAQFAEQWIGLSFSNVWRKLSYGLRAVTATLRNTALLSLD